MRSALLCCLLLLSWSPLSLAQDTRMIEFQLPWDDDTETVTDLSYLNSKPAGSLGPVRVGEDGHLYTGDRRIRFLGTNFTYRSALPSHEDAEKIAARLAKFGINVVRFHHIDAGWSGQAIFDPTRPGTRALSPESLDRLDHFFAELKKHGIYTNMNLLTGREFKAVDGLDPAIERMEWKEQQTPAFFDPHMIQLQKEYARLLLGRINPYTGIDYREDPALAFVEVINEHGLLHDWLGGGMDGIPDPYRDRLQSDWLSFLRNRYESQDELADQWTISSPAGPELIRNGSFHQGMSNWNLEEHQGAEADGTIENSAGPDGQPALKISIIQRASANWHIQLNQPGIPVEAGRVYQLHFRARASRPKEITVNIGQAHDPWQGLGFSRTIHLTRDWQAYQFSLVLNESDTNARVNFNNMGDSFVDFWFTDFSLAAGGTLGLRPEEDLEEGTIPILSFAARDERTESAQQDWIDFLWHTEEDYWKEMRRYLKEELGLQALLMGTVVGTSTPNLMALFDVIDSHAYWQHPSFEISWGSPWWLRNDSMVVEEDGGTVAGLGLKRIHGKPFSVSEYNHPFPNTFSAEAFYWLSLYAALQDWDALYAYTYGDGTRDFDQNYQEGFFDIHRDPNKIMSVFQAASIFRRGLVAPGKELVSVSSTPEEERKDLLSAGPWRLVDAGHRGIKPTHVLRHRTSLVIGEDARVPEGALSPDRVQVPEKGPFLSDTGQLTWDPDQRLFTLRAPRAQGLIGFFSEGEIDLGHIQLENLESLQGWAALFLSETEPKGEVRRLVLSAHGLMRNSGSTWQTYPGGEPVGFPPVPGQNVNLSVWGRGPVQVEAIRGDLILPYSAPQVRVFALDNRGARSEEVEVSSRNGRASFTFEPAYQTLWYEIEIAAYENRQALAGMDMSDEEFTGVALSNPTDSDADVRMILHAEGDARIPLPPETIHLWIPARQQVARLLGELFETDLSAVRSAWVEVLSDVPKLGVFSQSGNFGLTHLDGSAAFAAGSDHLVLTGLYDGETVFRGARARSTLYFTNPGESPCVLEMAFYPAKEGGTDFGEENIEGIPLEIPARGQRTVPLENLLGRSGVRGSLAVKVVSGEGVFLTNRLLLPDHDTLYVLTASPVDDAAVLYSAQLASLPDLLFTRIHLFNRGEETAKARLRAVSNNGDKLAQEEISIDPETTEVIDAKELFAAVLVTHGELIGSLEVRIVEGQEVSGSVFFGLENLQYGAAQPLQSSPFREAVFSHVASLPGLFYTGLAIYNITNRDAEVTISIYSPGGDMVAESKLELSPGERLSRTVRQLMGAEPFSITGGYIRIQSTRRLIGQELFGTENLSLLSAVPPLILH